MKKFLSVLIALVTFAGIADAQISIKKSDVGKPEQMTTLSMSWSWIYRIDVSYFIVMKSDNQFDDRFWMKIGTTREECMESLSALQDLCKTIGDSDRFEMDNGDGETFYVTKYKAMGASGLRFHEDSHAGTAYILGANLNKAVKWIEKNVK